MDVNVSILVNNAGVFTPGFLTTIDDEAVVKSFEVNVFASFRLIKLFLPRMMRDNHGTVITISSVTGHLGVARGSPYVSSKAALSMVHECLVHETRDYSGIRTLLGEFGHINTTMFHNLDYGWTRFVLPTLDRMVVAERIVDRVQTRSEGVLVWPLTFNLWHFYVILPLRMRIFVAWLLNANTSFDKVQRSVSLEPRQCKEE